METVGLVRRLYWAETTNACCCGDRVLKAMGAENMQQGRGAGATVSVDGG